MSQRRLLLVGDAASPHTTRLIEPLQRLGWRVGVADFGESRGHADEFFSLGTATSRDLRFATAIPRFAGALRRFRPAVVHAHFVASYGVLAAFGSGRTPIVASAWGSDVLSPGDRPRWTAPLVTAALRRARVVTGDSGDVLEAVASRAPNTPRQRVIWGPEAEWTTAPRRDHPEIFSPRQPRDFYRVDTIVEAFGQLGRDFEHWSLAVAAWGEPSPQLRESRDRSHRSEAIRFLPFLNRSELRDQNLRVGVFCSVPEHDATSVSVLEGMGAGAFPILSDLPANREWVRDGENGLLVPSGNVAALLQALERACGDAELRARAAEINRQLIRDRASLEHAVETLDLLYGRFGR